MSLEPENPASGAAAGQNNQAKLADVLQAEAVARVKSILPELFNTRKLIAEGKPVEVEPPERREQFEARNRNRIIDTSEVFKAKARDPRFDDAATAVIDGDGRVSGAHLERQIGAINDLLPMETLFVGLLAAKSVGRLTVGGMESGTGFMVGNQILITNHHVISTPEDALSSVFELNVLDSRFQKPKNVCSCDLDPNTFFLTNKELDFTLVYVSPQDDSMKLKRFGWHALIDTEGKILIGHPVNIVQHPKGESKQIVMHNSNLLYLGTDSQINNFCYYTGDTEEGSSGSPLFNKYWEVIGLHHRAVLESEVKSESASPSAAAASNAKPVFVANEGVRISRIVKAIADTPLTDKKFAAIRDGLLNLWRRPGAQISGLKAAAPL